MNGASLPPLSTVLDAIRWATQQLQTSRIDHPRLNAELLLGQTINLSRLELYLKFDRPLDQAEIDAFSRLVERRSSGEPGQYILGCVEFYGLSFSVNPSVLIPRPETERLIDHVKAFLSGLEADQEAASALQLDLFAPLRNPEGRRTVVDIGTGSGVIALTLAHLFPEMTVYATDVSPEALGVARTNAEHLGVAGRVRLRHGDFLEALRSEHLAGGCDLIVSNPPYVRRAEIDRLPVEIRDHEPRCALDGGADGLNGHRRLIEASPVFLRPGGMLAMEIGADQGGQVVELLSGCQGFRDITVIKDYTRRDRVVSAVYTG
jgi:release factor glutamine methyltransferase